MALSYRRTGQDDLERKIPFLSRSRKTAAARLWGQWLLYLSWTGIKTAEGKLLAP